MYNSMTTEIERIAEEFQEFDIEINDAEVLSKLEDIALAFSLNADELVNEWLAYQSRNQQCVLSCPELEQLEKELSSTKAKAQAKRVTHCNLNEQSFNLKTHSSDIEMANLNDSKSTIDIIEGYCSPKNRNKLQKMNVDTPSNLNEHMCPAVISSPFAKSYSEKYVNRSNSGEVVSFLCDETGTETTAWPEIRAKEFDVVSSNSNTKDNYKYMFQKVMDVSDILNDNVELFSQEFQKQFGDCVESFSSCSSPCQTETVIVGRIKNEHQGRLNAQSVVLEGDRVNSFGRSINVDLQHLTEYSLFTGQTVAIKGINPTGKKFIASSIISPVYPDNSLILGNIKDFENCENCLSMFIAAGPFTTTDSLNYEPLKDFISTVKQHKPSVTLFVGPLLDCSNKCVESGLVNLPFNEFANKWIDFIRTSLESYTHIVFIPSERDVFHHPVFPQPPYMQKKSNQTHFMGNPCKFTVGDIQVGTTSVDTLFHIGAEEISKTSTSSPTDRLSRLINHLFAQKSFYPLYPTNESVSMDFLAGEFECKLSSDIDVLVLPSDLKCFVKCIKGRVCVNPGRLVKGYGGGTYARIIINCSREKKVMAQVVKI